MCGLTGSLVRAGLLTLRPNASSWNCRSWTTRPARDLLEGESFWTYWVEEKQRSEFVHRKEKKKILPPRLSFKTSFNWLYSTIPNSTVAPGTKLWSVFGGPESSMTVILCLAVRRHRNVAKTLQRITDHTLRWWWWWTCSQFLHKRGSYKTLQNCFLGGI